MAKKADLEKQKLAIMQNLKVTEAEADEILAADYAIDHGEKTDFDLPPEKEKVAKQYAKSQDHKKATTPVKRERAENVTKSGLITALATFLNGQNCTNVVITNKERQISFAVGENTFDLTLVQHRQPKK